MGGKVKTKDDELMELTLQIRNRKDADKQYAKFHGDSLIGDKNHPQEGFASDFEHVFAVPKNWPAFGRIIEVKLKNLLHGSHNNPDARDLAQIAGSYSNYSKKRQTLIDGQVKAKYDRMLHPPLTYLGDAFQYRTADGKFNSVIHPHLGQAGAPYAKTVPSKTAPLGALPDPGDLFDKLMARQPGGRQSQSGLSSMLIYHATIIIHDIFRTNANDKNISDSSSYLDLSPLYGYTMKMQEDIRDDKYKLGFLKPDTFAEDRLLRQPPGVCIMLVMYNRYHNYAAAQLRRINENGRFSVPKKYANVKLVAAAKYWYQVKYRTADFDPEFIKHCDAYESAWHNFQATGPPEGSKLENLGEAHPLEAYLKDWRAEDPPGREFLGREHFEELYDAAWKKLDDDLFNTARLITCGMYIQIAVHDYLRALMGFHQYDTNFTLDPRTDFDQRQTSRGIGNQVTVEFNVLYRFHCAISLKDEKYSEAIMKEELNLKDPANVTLQEFLLAGKLAREQKEKKKGEEPPVWERTFGLKHDNDVPDYEKQHFARNKTTGLFDDQQMIDTLLAAMDDPISNFGPRNTPKCLKPVEIMGILQARKWEIGTLNDFREFFGMDRHKTFESITDNVEIQNALRDLYEHPDKVELYPGAFCESDEYMGLDPGPSKHNYALWVAIFSDAITLVRSDRFYTVDWNTNSLTSWGMKEVTPDNEINKSSLFHRLVQRAFPGWFPYDSIRFFHPFYTAQQNAKFARAQGYAPNFKMSQTPDQKNQETGVLEFNVSDSNPTKPAKPVYLHDFEKISAILDDKASDFIHPALRNKANLPRKMYEVLNADGGKPSFDLYKDQVMPETDLMTSYLTGLMQSIVKRESIAMSNATYQIDATRDFAIPVVTRYVADFLGFGHLIRTEKDLSGQYSENDIYQHITNCQVFLSYTVDETKLLQRRKAFKSSLEFLSDLTVNANIAEANAWKITQALFGRTRDNPMTELGFKTAQKIIHHESDPAKAAAILLLVGLDFAYNSVVAFTSVLNNFFMELYTAANSKSPSSKAKPTWLKIQELAFSEKASAHRELSEIVLTRARTSVRLPIVRVALKDRTFETAAGKEWRVKKDERVILDINEATVAALAGRKERDLDFLTYQSSFVEKFSAYQPRHIAVLALTSMVKFMAQMRNPRRGHDAQGRLKKIEFDWTAEGYSNFMAPGRVSRIAYEAEHQQSRDAHKIYTDKVLRPAIDSYLTAEWDEMVPFPTTWKIRFDGFGRSDYSSDGKPFGKLAQSFVPDDAPPWYQPQGLSHIGGSWAEVICACNSTEHPCPCVKDAHELDLLDQKITHGQEPRAAALEPTHATGCGLPH